MNENIEVYNWHRHCEMDLEDAVKYVKKRLQKPFLKPPFDDEMLKGKRVLDVGCGGGLKAVALAHYAKEVVGCDSSIPALDMAVKLAKEFNLTNITFFSNSIEDLPEFSAGRDFVFCLQVIHHINDWRGTIGQFHRLLGKDGILVISWLNFCPLLIKNKIAYWLGHNKKSRLIIGRNLFGWWDRRHNRIGIKWDSFFADRYSAHYKFISKCEMLKALRKFEILKHYKGGDIQTIYCRKI